jgi:hypothetical protein
MDASRPLDFGFSDFLSEPEPEAERFRFCKTQSPLEGSRLAMEAASFLCDFLLISRKSLT